MIINKKYIGLGEYGIDLTVKHMQNIIKKSACDYAVIQQAHKIIKDVPKTKWDEAEAIFEWVKRHTRFTHDPLDIEMVKTPQNMLYDIRLNNITFGDCDDITVLGCSLMRSIGLNTGLRVVGIFTPILSHVYGIVNLYGDSFIPFDASQDDYVFGQEPPHLRQKDYYDDE